MPDLSSGKRKCSGCGNFVDKNGVILGKHKGITHYTVGQRKGLNLAMGHPVFVTGIRPETNEVVIGEGNDVFSDHLVCKDVNWMAIDGLHGGEQESSREDPLQPQGISVYHQGDSRTEPWNAGLKSRSVRSRRDRQLYFMKMNV